MAERSDVFDRTYAAYLEQIAAQDLSGIARGIGARTTGDGIILSFFGADHTIAESGISGPDGRKPPFDVCVILSRYVIMWPGAPLAETGEWVPFRDFRDAGPLTGYFATEVIGPMGEHYADRLDSLSHACREVGGRAAPIDVNCDLAVTFEALPTLRLLLMFNDRDEDFPAEAALLFNRGADRYLDPECLAMAGGYLGRRLVAIDPNK